MMNLGEIPQSPYEILTSFGVNPEEVKQAIEAVAAIAKEKKPKKGSSPMSAREKVCV